MKVKSYYEWRVLSEDGLLKEFKFYSNYSEESLNPWGGYESEEEAIKGLEEKLSSIKFGKPSNLTLVKLFQEAWED